MLERIVKRGTLVTVMALIVCVLGILAAFRIPIGDRCSGQEEQSEQDNPS